MSNKLLRLMSVMAIAGVLSITPNVHAEPMTIEFIVEDGMSVTTGGAGDFLTFVGQSSGTVNSGTAQR